MKKNIKTYFWAMLIAFSGMLTACTEPASDLLEIVKPATGARVKFLHMVADGPGVSVLVNGKQLSGVLTVSPAVPNVNIYPSAFPSIDYATVEAGNPKFEVITATTPAVTALSATPKLDEGKRYSILAIGSLAAGTVEALFVEDQIPISENKASAPDTTKAYVRFINTVANGTTGYDLGINNVFSPELSNIRYKTVTNFIPLNPTPVGATAFPVNIRLNGTTVSLASTTVALTKGRYYTYIVRGRVGGTVTQVIGVSSYTSL
jgi:hypothetical protein